MVGFIAYFNDVEGNLCLRINRLSHKAWIRRFFSVISKLGDGGFWALMALAMYLLRGSQALPLIAQMAATGSVGIILYKLLKNRLVRERPYVNHHDILCGTAPLDKYSFPSGHTLHAVSFTILLWSFEPLLLMIAAPFAILVAASRVILGLHYPSDVIVGAAIGATLASTGLVLT
jgi:undecaprenyl-diphosphatase